MKLKMTSLNGIAVIRIMIEIKDEDGLSSLRVTYPALTGTRLNKTSTRPVQAVWKELRSENPVPCCRTALELLEDHLCQHAVLVHFQQQHLYHHTTTTSTSTTEYDDHDNHDGHELTYTLHTKAECSKAHTMEESSLTFRRE